MVYKVRVLALAESLQVAALSLSLPSLHVLLTLRHVLKIEYCCSGPRCYLCVCFRLSAYRC